MCLIPGGLTSHLQPADVSWNKPFKVAYRDLYNEWMSSGEKSFTAAGNMKAPDKLLCLEWVKKAWKIVTTEVIVNSFKLCGISSNTDGSEDGSIHCLKPGCYEGNSFNPQTLLNLQWEATTGLNPH